MRHRWQPLGMSHSAELLRNLITGQEVEKYVVDGSNSSGIEIELAVYELRMHELTGCVRVLYYSLEKQHSICGSPDFFVVLTERTDRLSDIGRLSLKLAKNLLRECLQGFDQLFAVFGLFEIEQSFIGIDQGGHAKVWLNTVFGQNTIDEEPSNTNSQQRQIRRLIGIIQRKIALEELPVDFGNEILRAESLQEAAWMIDQFECRGQHTPIVEQQKSRIIDNPIVKELKKARIEQIEQDRKALQHYHDQTRQQPFSPPTPATLDIRKARLVGEHIPSIVREGTIQLAKPVVDYTHVQIPPLRLQRNSSTPQLKDLALEQTFGRVRHRSPELQPELKQLPVPLHKQTMSRAVHNRRPSESMCDSLIHRADLRGDRLSMIPQVDSMLVIQPAEPQHWSRALYTESRVRPHI